MNKYPSLIVEDEIHSRELLHDYLTRYCPDVDILAMAKNVEDAYEQILIQKPCLVFLDISLLDQDAFELLAKFEQISFEIIFITAYNDFAIKAIKVSAIDYLLKPINIEQLVNAVNRAVKRIRERSSLDHLNFFDENIKRPGELSRIALPTLTGFVLVETKDIVRCKAEGSYTGFYFVNRKPIMVSRGLKEFDELLSGHHFIRVHNSHLINLKHVSEYHKGKLSYIIMADGSEVEVSVRKRDEFLDRLQNPRS
jgi:two-component system LytT family response regulator